MCGIAGYADLQASVDKEQLLPMTNSIKHRGPDSGGSFFSKDKHCAMGIRRLSIIDLVTGDQPIKNEDGSVVVVYNGEIYNYKDLVKDLIKKGHKFRTKTDTEVLVHLYEEYGPKMAKKLNGMFAFSIWDEKNQKLFIARDRAGIKPLYYYHSGKKLVWGSEPKTILKNSFYDKKISNKALSLYGFFGYIPGELSMFEGIKKLLPGHTLTFSKSGIKIEKYFEVDTTANAIKSLEELLNDSVKSQLMSDVPLGVLLSGGLDSGLVSYFATKNKADLKSFSIGFKDKAFDESDFAKVVAKKLGTKHHVDYFEPKDVPQTYEELIKKIDEPLADRSLLPTYKVSKFAREHVTVALSGDGGDELFGGYPTYKGHIFAWFFAMLPDNFYDNGTLLSLVDIFPEGLFRIFNPILKFKSKYSVKEPVTTYLKGFDKDPAIRHAKTMRQLFLGDEDILKKPDLSFIPQMIKDFSGEDIVRQIQILDFKTYLRDNLLTKVDRASMFTSLEVRVPYLDNDVIDFAFSYKKRHTTLFSTKKLLRQIAQKHLPEIANLPKSGFGIPIATWLREDLFDFAAAVLDNKKLEDLVGKDKVQRLLSEHKEGSKDNSGVLWQLIMLAGWLDNWA